MPGRSFTSGTTTKEKFTGKERDTETGLDYFGARYYDPAIGRWISVDPALSKMTPNELVEFQDGQLLSNSSYNYTYNNPIIYTDPDGQAPNPAVIGAIAGTVAGAIFEIAAQRVKGEEFNFQKVFAAGVGGAVSGGAAGLIIGAKKFSPIKGAGLLSFASADVLGCSIERMIDGDISTSGFDDKDKAIDALFGALGGIGSTAIGDMLTKMGYKNLDPEMMRAVAQTLVESLPPGTIQNMITVLQELNNKKQSVQENQKKKNKTDEQKQKE